MERAEADVRQAGETETEMICAECGNEISIGCWPYCPHGSVNSRSPFKPWYDEHLEQEVSSLVTGESSRKTDCESLEVEGFVGLI